MLQLVLIFSGFSLIASLYTIFKLTPRRIRNAGQSVLLDTSALIDGRVLEVVKSGFVPEELLIPRFVIAELQLLADKADHTKRERARFGLQVIQDLQDSRYSKVTIISDDIKEEAGVDEKLVKLGLKLGALLFTTDYNLLKVAEIEGLRVLNINELAQNLRPTHIPGECTDIKIVGKGQERTQGVGYLPDGTLVVVENAGNSHNQTVKVEFTRNLQTTAGRMMFAKIVKDTQKQAAPAKKVPARTRVAPKAVKPSKGRSAVPRAENTQATRPTQKYQRRKSYKEAAEDSLIEAIESK